MDDSQLLLSKEEMQFNTVQIDVPTEHQILVLERVKNARQEPGRLLDWDEAILKLS